MMRHTILNLLLATLLLGACQPVILAPQDTDVKLLEQGLVVDTAHVADEKLEEEERAILLEANNVLAYRYVEEMWNLGNMDIATEILADDFVDYALWLGSAPSERSDKLSLIDEAASFHASGKRNELNGVIVAGDSIVLRITVLHPENGEDLDEVAEYLILLKVKDDQITERHVSRVYRE